MQDELLDRFGDLPRPVQNLLAVADLKVKAHHVYVKELVEQNHWPVSKAFENQVMCDLEDGIIDFCALRDLLEEVDYKGIAVIEQDMYNKTAAYAYQTAKKNLQYLREIRMIG